MPSNPSYESDEMGKNRDTRGADDFRVRTDNFLKGSLGISYDQRDSSK